MILYSIFVDIVDYFADFVGTINAIVAYPKFSGKAAAIKFYINVCMVRLSLYKSRLSSIHAILHKILNHDRIS